MQLSLDSTPDQSLPPFMRPLATEPPDPTQQPDYDPEAGIRRMGFVVEHANARPNSYTTRSGPIRSTVRPAGVTFRSPRPGAPSTFRQTF